MNEALENYIKEARAHGMSDGDIRAALAAGGWKAEDIDQGFSLPAAPAAPGAASKAPDVVYPEEAPPSGRPNMTAILVMVAGILVIAGGVTFAYFKYFTPRLSPAEVLGKMYAAMQDVKTFTFDGGVTSTVDTSASSIQPGGLTIPSNVSIVARISGEMDMSDLSNISNSSTASISVTSSQSQSASAAWNLVVLDHVYYIKLNQLNLALGNDAAAGRVFEAFVQLLMGQWLKFDPAEMSQMQQPQQPQQVRSSTALTVGQMQEIENIMAASGAFSVSQVFPDDSVNGVATYHYEIAVDKNNLKSMLVSMTEALASSSIRNAGNGNSSVSSSIGSIVDNINFNDIELWIDKSDFRIGKVVADISAEPSDQAPGLGKTSEDIQVTQTLGDYNQPIDLAAPQGAKDIISMLGGLFGASSSSTFNSPKVSAPAGTGQIAPYSPPSSLSPTQSFGSSGGNNVTLSPTLGGIYKAGSSYSVAWSTPSGAAGLPVSVELYRGSTPCSYNNRYGTTYSACGIRVGSSLVYSSKTNSDGFTWTVPFNIVNGSDYSLVLFFNGAIGGQSATFSVQN